MSGEETYEKGRERARRAKEWLESTTRMNACWVNPDKFAVEKQTFPWAAGKSKPFSYHLGIPLLRGHLEGWGLYAEVKNYTNASNNQGSEYVEYSAECYCAYLDSPKYCDNFMWITWYPFSLKKSSSPKAWRTTSDVHTVRV